MRLFACGSNGKYQLGNGTNIDSEVLVPCKFKNGLEFLDVEIPVKMAHGGNHSLILFNNGDVYSTGDNSHGQCGFDKTENPFIHVFTKVPGKWLNIACGWAFSIFSKMDGIYICGSGHKGELGLGPDVKECSLTKVPFDNLGVVLDIKCSIDFTILKTSEGFYGWGNLKRGQLTVKSIVWSPIKLELDPRAKIEVTKDSTVILTPERLYSIGKIAIEIHQPIKQVKTMWTSIHYQINHMLFAIGNNSHSQLLDNELQGFLSFETGSEHGLLQYDNIYAWGWGEHGNCGAIKDSTNFTEPICIYEGIALFMSCGCSTTFIGSQM